MTQYKPQGYHTLTPSVAFRDARRAIEFYQKAFGAKERYALPGPNGKGVMHAELEIGDSVVMLGDETPDGDCPSAETLGHATFSFALYVPDSAAVHQQALRAGATLDKPVTDLFWGDRGGSVKDPFGYTWWILTHTRDLSPEEIAKAAREAMAQPAGTA